MHRSITARPGALAAVGLLAGALAFGVTAQDAAAGDAPESPAPSSSAVPRLAGLLTPSPLPDIPSTPARDDRLVEACQVAVLAHADHVSLHFPGGERTGLTVTIDIEIDGAGGRHIGEATCAFRESPVSEPPSLLSFEAMGKSGYGLFLVSHHAVWSHFTRPAVPGGEAVAPPEEDRDTPRPSQREKTRMRASL